MFRSVLTVKFDKTLSFVAGTPQLNRFLVSVAGSTRFLHDISSVRFSSLNSLASSTGDVYTWPTLPYHQVVVVLTSGKCATFDSGMSVLQMVVPVNFVVWSGYTLSLTDCCVY